MKLPLLLPASAVVLAVVACSGASSTELFDIPTNTRLGTDPGASSGQGSSGAASSSGAGSSGSSDDGTASSSGASNSSSSSSGSTSSSGGAPDAGKDAAPPPKSGTIHCGSPGGTQKSCTAGTEVCCGSWAGGGNLKFACEPAGIVACATGTSIACDDKTDCPNGQVCCGTLEDNSGYTSVECRNKCNSVPGLRAVRFCDPDAAVDECAAINKYCGPSQSLPGYFVCKD